MNVMHTVSLEAPRKIKYGTSPLPAPEPGWVLLRSLRCGICGTDAHSYLGETIFGRVFPFHIGHEVCGRVAAAGDGCRLAEGDIAVINPFFSCGHCLPCRMGHQNMCENKTTIGLKGPGGFSEYIYVPDSSAVKVAADTDPAVLSMCEPLATVVYGYEKLKTDSTKRVLIKGAGTIGLLFVRLFQLDQIPGITISDLRPEKLKIAADMGVDRVCTADQLHKSAPETFDIIVDCTGSIRSMRDSVDLLNAGGQLLLFGIAPSDQEMSISPFRLYQKDASIFFSYALNVSSFEKAVTYLSHRQIDVSPIIQGVYPLSYLEEGILSIVQGKSTGKIIIDTEHSYPGGPGREP